MSREPLGDDESEVASETEGWSAYVPDFVKRAAVAGLGALFMTEEGLRSLAGQLKLPKDAIGYLLNQAERTKAEIGRVVSEEVRRFFQSEKLREEFLKLLAGMTVEIKAEVRLVPSAKGGEGAKEPGGAKAKLVVSEVGARRSKKGGRRD
jgi:hypothetical protein